MKKLMFMLATVACAATMQAAQLDWSLSKNSITTPDSSTTYMTGQTSYLLVFATSAAADALYNGLKNGDTTLASAVASAVDSGVGSTSSKSKGSISKTANHSSLVEGATYYAALLTVSGADKFILSATMSGMAYDPNGTVETEGNAITFVAGNFSTTAESRTGWTTAAPEPTSGILMLVGLGALALRRRKLA